MIKLICSDVDGTLLNKQREVDSFTKNIIALLRGKIPVVLASSRMPKALFHIQNDLGIISEPIICYNGGLVLMGGDTFAESKIIATFTIAEPTVNEIIAFACDYDIHVSVYLNDSWFVNKMDKWAQREINNTKAHPEDMLDPLKSLGTDAHKIMIMGEAEKISAIEKKLSNVNVSLCRSKDTYLEITPPNVNKYTALMQALGLIERYRNIKSDSIAAFGDNHNDYELIKNVKYGIAVANAVPALKEIAFEVTESNVNHGVALYLQKLLTDVALLG